MARPSAIPARGGVGLKAEHYRHIIEARPDIGFIEVHAENYMGDGGPPHRYLEAIRALYPLSLHGVGLSIGGPGPLDRAHLGRLRELIRRYEPGLFSEHLAWSSHGAVYLADLLPLPLTDEILGKICDHIDETQEFLGRQMLLENPASYLAFAESTWGEAEFLAEVAKRTGCGLLLDINNVFVSAINTGFEPAGFIAAFALDQVGEIHLAGHDAKVDGEGKPLLIDSHGAAVADPVWDLFALTVARAGPRPSLIERDNAVPAFPVLAAEAARADAILAGRRQAA